MALRAFLNRLRRMRLDFGRPKRADVVIYDEGGADELLQFVDDQRTVILDLSGTVFNFWVLVGTLIRGGWSMHDYALRYLAWVRPRVVLTLIDTTPSFYRIKNTYPQIVTAAVQNGWRSIEFDTDMVRESRIEPLRADRVFCFGETAAGLYRQHIDVEPVIAGSFRSNHVSVLPPPTDDVVVLVSTIRPKVDLDAHALDHRGRPTVRYREIYERRVELALHVAHFCQRNGLRLVIAGKDLDPSREHAYYGAAFASSDVDWKFVPRTERLGSYALIDQARIVVSSSSTLGYEALARGRRSAFFMLDPEVTGNPGERFAWPEPFPDRGPFWTNFLDANAVAEILEFLHALDDREWAELRNAYVPRLISDDPGNSQLRAFLGSLGVAKSGAA
jgi:surface carbohydrate biosynthesis protein